jgi:uncharacterized protein (DUF1697 family)
MANRLSTYAALLRGINVGGRKMVAMSDLRDMFESLGFVGARSLLQSGNLVFQSTRRTTAGLERLLEQTTEERLKVVVDYIVRDSAEWESVVARNPFPREAKLDPSHLVVMFLKEPPQSQAVQSLQAAITGPEIVRSDGKQLYVSYPAGIGQSKLTNTLIEKRLAIRGTVRNWNTIIKVAALMTT